MVKNVVDSEGLNKISRGSSAQIMLACRSYEKRKYNRLKFEGEKEYSGRIYKIITFEKKTGGGARLVAFIRRLHPPFPDTFRGV